MDLNFTPEEIAFRDEARHFFRTAIPDSIRAKVAEGEGLTRDDMINAQRILNQRGWATVNWPVEWGGQDWTPIQVYLYQDEMQQAQLPGADRLQRLHGRSRHRPVRQPGTQGALPAGHRQRRHLLVPGLLRTRLRLRSGIVAHQGGEEGRQVHHQRPEDLDHAGAIRRLDFLSYAAPIPVPKRRRGFRSSWST